MAEPAFKSGDVVMLKSGGPRMTVVSYGKPSYSSTDSYKCKWFDDKHKLTEGRFAEAELNTV